MAGEVGAAVDDDALEGDYFWQHMLDTCSLLTLPAVADPPPRMLQLAHEAYGVHVLCTLVLGVLLQRTHVRV